MGPKSAADTVPINGIVTAMALSPGGEAVALELYRGGEGNSLAQIWLKRLGGATQLVTTEARGSYEPVWMPNGLDLIYTTEFGTELYRRRADGSGGETLLGRLPGAALEMTLHPDGRTLVVRGEASVQRRRTLFRMTLDSTELATPLLPGAKGESSPAFSPDGKWLAYVSIESGRSEVYVLAFPNVDSMKAQVSIDGGVAPRWNPRGGELFFLSPTGDMMAAQIATSPSFSVRQRTRLFTPVGFLGRSSGALHYDVSPDGQRFLMLDVAGARRNASVEHAVLVQGFGAELSRRLP